MTSALKYPKVSSLNCQPRSKLFLEDCPVEVDDSQESESESLVDEKGFVVPMESVLINKVDNLSLFSTLEFSERWPRPTLTSRLFRVA